MTLLAGIYGLGFAEMPEHRIHNACFILLGVARFIAVILLPLLRKIWWL